MFSLIKFEKSSPKLNRWIISLNESIWGKIFHVNWRWGMILTRASVYFEGWVNGRCFWIKMVYMYSVPGFPWNRSQKHNRMTQGPNKIVSRLTGGECTRKPRDTSPVNLLGGSLCYICYARNQEQEWRPRSRCLDSILLRWYTSKKKKKSPPRSNAIYHLGAHPNRNPYSWIENKY